MRTLHVTELDPADTNGVRAYVDLVNAVQAADSPWAHPVSPGVAEGLLRRGWDGEPPRVLLAREGEEAVGFLEYWTSSWDNLDLAWLWFAVHPDRRRRGIGSDLVGRAYEVARADGRPKLGAEGWESPATTAFAERHGFARASQAINRRQYLEELDLDRVRELFADAEAHAGDYELLRIDGTTPNDLLDKVAEMTAAINDAPLDDLDLEDEVFPPERIRRYEQAQLDNGYRLHRLVARHRPTGTLVGHTVVAVEADRPWIGHQHDTSVVRAHRGHRLGLLLKAGMVLWLREVEPQLSTVDTWNAESNDHMIAVNEQLGYRVLGRGVQYQRRLD